MAIFWPGVLNPTKRILRPLRSNDLQKLLLSDVTYSVGYCFYIGLVLLSIAKNEWSTHMSSITLPGSFVLVIFGPPFSIVSLWTFSSCEADKDGIGYYA